MERVFPGEQSSIMLYFNQEIEESWRVARKGHTDSGAAIWLPNNTFLDIRMVRASSRGSTADKAEDMSNSPAPGLLLSFSWLVNPQTAISKHFHRQSPLPESLVSGHLQHLPTARHVQWNLLCLHFTF